MDLLDLGAAELPVDQLVETAYAVFTVEHQECLFKPPPTIPDSTA